MLAAGLADVRIGDAHPLVGGGIAQHVLDELAVARLDLGAVVERAARLVQPVGEVVAELLELAQAQQPRAAAPVDAELDARARVSGDEGGGELGLDLGDLLAKRASGGKLVTLDDERRNRGNGRPTERFVDCCHNRPSRARVYCNKVVAHE